MSTPSLPATPAASDDATRRAMQGNRRTDTSPEVALRRALHGLGLRFRKDYRISAGEISVRADVVFPARRVAVFLDGCYWHGCPEHCRMPARNADYWTAKITRNRARDQRNNAALTANGWTFIRVWEHESPAEAAARVAGALSAS